MGMEIELPQEICDLLTEYSVLEHTKINFETLILKGICLELLDALSTNPSRQLKQIF
jgi:hypothetical protein